MPVASREGMERDYVAGQGCAEEHAITILAASYIGAVQVPVGGLHQSCYRGCTVTSTGEVVQNGQGAIRTHAEKNTSTRRAAAISDTVEVAVICLDQPGIGRLPLVPSKFTRTLKSPDELIRKIVPLSPRATSPGSSVEVVVCALHQLAPFGFAPSMPCESVKQREVPVLRDPVNSPIRPEFRTRF